MAVCEGVERIFPLGCARRDRALNSGSRGLLSRQRRWHLRGARSRAPCRCQAFRLRRHLPPVTAFPTVYPTPGECPADPPADPYAFTKYLGEQLVLHWARVYHCRRYRCAFSTFTDHGRALAGLTAPCSVSFWPSLAGEP